MESHQSAQDGFAFRFDWGADGLRTLAPAVAVVVVVDVLRFCSAVSAALESGAAVLPHGWADDSSAAFAVEQGATLAGRRGDGGPSLSPTDLLQLAPGTRVVLPSPNGAALSLAAADLGVRHVLAGCLRNATATANAARSLAGTEPIAVIAAGERRLDASGPLRLAVEDLIGAGAVLAALDPSAAISAPCCSPEAAAARAAFVAARPRLYENLAASTSGRDLIRRGWADDVATSAALDVTGTAALLTDAAFTAHG